MKSVLHRRWIYDCMGSILLVNSQKNTCIFIGEIVDIIDNDHRMSRNDLSKYKVVESHLKYLGVPVEYDVITFLK